MTNESPDYDLSGDVPDLLYGSVKKKTLKAILLLFTPCKTIQKAFELLVVA